MTTTEAAPFGPRAGAPKPEDRYPLDNHRHGDVTNGYLPAAAFRHLDPTGVGFVDLDGPLVLSRPAGASWGPRDRDGLLLVRLHGEPLDVLHIDRRLDSLSVEELAAVIWRDVGVSIRNHTERWGCMAPPHDQQALLCGLPPTVDCCPRASASGTCMSVTIIVPTGGRAAQLERCLRSLLAIQRPQPRVLVIDNQPQLDETKRRVAEIADGAPQLGYVAESRPGSSVARNRGIAETDSEFVVFTDDDVVVDSEWLHWLLAPFVEPNVAVVTGMVLPMELQTEAQKRFEQYAGFSKGLGGRPYDLRANRADERLLYPYWGGVFGSGNSMAFRRADLASAGGFDPALGAGSLALAGADIEAFSAAILRGGQLVYEPRSLCWHEHRRADDALRRQLFNYGVGFSAILTKYLTHDPRFLAAIARSLMPTLRRYRQSGGGRSSSVALPAELARLTREGMLRGPLLYAKSWRWSRRLGLDGVVHGR
jgi:GT2 family glycosyltransferase